MRLRSLLAIGTFVTGLVLSAWTGSRATAGPIFEPGDAVRPATPGLIALYEVCTDRADAIACGDGATRGAATLAQWITFHDTATVELEQLLPEGPVAGLARGGPDRLWLTLLCYGHDVVGFDPLVPVVDIGLSPLLLAQLDPSGGRFAASTSEMN